MNDVPQTTANVSLEKVRADLQEWARVPGLTVDAPPRYLWTAATVAHVQAKQYGALEQAL